MRAISPSSRMISQMTPAGSRPGQARQIDRALGLARAHQHAAAPRAQREDVAGRDQVVGPASRATATRMVSARSRAEMPVVDPAARVDADRERRVRGEPVVGRHHRQPELRDALLGQRQADEAAPVARHEVDRLGRDQIGGHHQVALVLAILVVDEDHHAARRGSPRSRARRPRDARARRSQRTKPYLLERLDRHARGAGVCAGVVVACARTGPPPADRRAWRSVGLEVDGGADRLVAQLGDRQRVRDQRDTENTVAMSTGVDRQADAVDGDRALAAAIARRPAAAPEMSSSSAAPCSRRATTVPDAVDVAADQVAAQRIAEPQRPLEVDARCRARARRAWSAPASPGRGRPRSARARRGSTTVRQTPSTAMLAPSGSASTVEVGGDDQAHDRRRSGSARCDRLDRRRCASTMPVNMIATVISAARSAAISSDHRDRFARWTSAGEQQIFARRPRTASGPSRSARASGRPRPGRDGDAAARGAAARRTARPDRRGRRR